MPSKKSKTTKKQQTLSSEITSQIIIALIALGLTAFFYIVFNAYSMFY